MNKWPWFLQLLWSWPRALDLTDNEGNIDHGKILPAILLFSAILLHALGNGFSATTLIVLGSLSYGYGAWRSFLRSKTVMGKVSETLETTVRHKIIERRDADEGIEPTQD